MSWRVTGRRALGCRGSMRGCRGSPCCLSPFLLTSRPRGSTSSLRWPPALGSQPPTDVPPLSHRPGSAPWQQQLTPVPGPPPAAAVVGRHDFWRIHLRAEGLHIMAVRDTSCQGELAAGRGDARRRRSLLATGLPRLSSDAGRCTEPVRTRVCSALPALRAGCSLNLVPLCPPSPMHAAPQARSSALPRASSAATPSSPPGAAPTTATRWRASAPST